MAKSTEKFSGRAASYLRSRPTYPPQVTGVLQLNCGLNESSVVADIGCGTGFLAELFLRAENRVHGVEPNREMREAAIEYLSDYPRFSLHAGRAEATGLAAGSIDFVVAGQAFHWFDPSAARHEFERILRRHGWIVIVWNFRRESVTALMQEYERLLKIHGTDYQEVHRRQKDTGGLLSVFGSDFFQQRTFFWEHQLQAHEFEDRLFSSSYLPSADSSEGRKLLDDARALFDEYEESGKVNMHYETVLYFGQLT